MFQTTESASIHRKHTKKMQGVFRRLLHEGFSAPSATKTVLLFVDPSMPIAAIRDRRGVYGKSRQAPELERLQCRWEDTASMVTR